MSCKHYTTKLCPQHSKYYSYMWKLVTWCSLRQVLQKLYLFKSARSIYGKYIHRYIYPNIFKLILYMSLCVIHTYIYLCNMYIHVYIFVKSRMRDIALQLMLNLFLFYFLHITIFSCTDVWGLWRPEEYNESPGT